MSFSIHFTSKQQQVHHHFLISATFVSKWLCVCVLISLCKSYNSARVRLPAMNAEWKRTQKKRERKTFPLQLLLLAAVKYAHLSYKFIHVAWL